MSSVGQVALGLASLVLGAHHIRNGATKLAGVRRNYGSPGSGRYGRPTRSRGGRRAGFQGFERAINPRTDYRRGAFHDSGRQMTPQGAMRMRSYHIRNLDDRIKYLRRLVDQGKRDPRIYAFVRDAVNKRCGAGWCIPEKDNVKEARAIFNAVRRRVRYTSDIHGVDTYQKPGNTLALGTADCDDYSTLLCSAMLSAGIPCRFKVIRTKGGRDWNHIYAQAGFPRQAPQRWISMDASVPVPFGWEAPKNMVEASRVFSVR